MSQHAGGGKAQCCQDNEVQRCQPVNVHGASMALLDVIDLERSWTSAGWPASTLGARFSWCAPSVVSCNLLVTVKLAVPARGLPALVGPDDAAPDHPLVGDAGVAHARAAGAGGSAGQLAGEVGALATTGGGRAAQRPPPSAETESHATDRSSSGRERCVQTGLSRAKNSDARANAPPNSGQASGSN